MITNLLKQLNPDQKKAVLHGEGPALVFAGAGSGKTRALIYRAAYLIKEKGVPAENILLVTFTNKAAHEMKKRLEKLLGTDKNNLPHASTFHSWCASVLRREAPKIGLDHNFVIYDDSEQMALIKEIFKKLNVSAKSASPRSVLSTISQAKNELITHLEYPQYAKGHFQELVADIYLLYQKSLAAYRAVDFDDLLLKTVQLLEKEKDVLEKYSNKYWHVLVDEYQDTNLAQYKLSKSLAKRWRNLFVVGDCSQSIYSWRGADFRNVLKLEKDFPDLKTYRLEQNYRSVKNILTAAYAVINKNSTHPILKLWTDKKNGEKITLIASQNEKKEAESVLTEIVRATNAGRSYQDIAVLYRTNSQSRTFEEAFIHAGIPYTLVGGTRFYERMEIKDVLSYLRLAVNPNDGMALTRVEKLGIRRKEKFNQLIKKSPELKDQKTVDIMDLILTATCYAKRYDPKDEQDLARIENIKELRSVAVEFPNISDFLQNVALLQNEQMPDKELKQKFSGVTLMTLHSAKGLEFDTVFMVGMEEGLFPHSRSIIDKHELEEERRLCYVGITRAKNKLYMSYCANRLYFGTKMYNTISRFITDLPDSLVLMQ